MTILGPATHSRAGKGQHPPALSPHPAHTELGRNDKDIGTGDAVPAQGALRQTGHLGGA